MDAGQQLLAIIIVLATWATLTTVILLLVRRDVKLGLKKWLMVKLRRQPIKIRFHGSDKNVLEDIVGLKGKGETVTLFDKKLLFIKTPNGSTFFIDPKCIRRGDDGINEISYNFDSIMPIDPTKSEEQVKEENKEIVMRTLTDEERAQINKQNAAYAGIELDALVKTSDPKRLNRLIEYIYLAAKADALAQATDLQKWIKYTFFAAAGALVIGVVIYYNLDAKVLPLLNQLGASINSLGATLIKV